jgi:hypothetical protein
VGSRKVLVPSTKQPVYEPVSKSLLVPGTEVRKPTADSAWLVQKHRDIIADFFDVDPAEKEFIQEWDAFVINERITSDIFLPRAWVGFVKEKAAWLVSSPERMIEFGKHLSYLVTRNALDTKSVSEALLHISNARDLRITGRDQLIPSPKQSPKAGQCRKSSNGCQICGLSVLGPRLLMCSNKVDNTLLSGISNRIC